MDLWPAGQSVEGQGGPAAGPREENACPGECGRGKRRWPNGVVLPPDPRSVRAIPSLGAKIG